MFNLRPELIEKSLKVSKALDNDAWFFKRHVVSSASWLIFIRLSSILIPSISLSSLILWAKVSAAIIKRNAERGQPCLMPRVGVVSLLFRTYHITKLFHGGDSVSLITFEGTILDQAVSCFRGKIYHLHFKVLCIYILRM